jgi:hypothetical protein
MRKIGFVILVLMIVTGSAVFADQAEAKNNLLIIADELEAQYGLKRVEGTFGQVFDVAEGNYIEINRTLYGGVAYYIIGAGDRYAQDVILALFDENWNLVGKDVRPEPGAIIKVQPKWTGPFFVRVGLNQASGSAASIGYIIMYEPQ